MELKKIYFGILSGRVYTVDADEVKNLDEYQVPIKDKPKPSCKRCFGRGYTGIHTNPKYYAICKCIHKHIDFNAIKEKEAQKRKETTNEVN